MKLFIGRHFKHIKKRLIIYWVKKARYIDKSENLDKIEIALLKEMCSYFKNDSAILSHHVDKVLYKELTLRGIDIFIHFTYNSATHKIIFTKKSPKINFFYEKFVPEKFIKMLDSAFDKEYNKRYDSQSAELEAIVFDFILS